MVKRLRHHPFTVVSRVRIPVGSPKTSPSGSGRTLHGVVERSEKPIGSGRQSRRLWETSPSALRDLGRRLFSMLVSNYKVI